MTGIGISLFINMLVMFIIPVYVNMDLPIATPVSNLVWLGFTWLAIERYHFFKLDSEEQSFRKVISKMQEFLFFMDKYATIERTNSYSAKLLQVNEEELCGCKLLDFIENNKEILEIITAQEAFYYAVNYEVEFKTKNGSRIPARISFLSITDRFNDIMGYVVIGHDTRNEIHLKQEILHKNNIQKDLVEAKEKAEESEKLKTSFLLNTSHEIRTPMNSIIGYANLLREEIGLTPAKDEYLRYIEINSKHLLRLIDDILDISKIETNSLKISMSECNLNGLLDEVYNNMISERNLMDKEHIRLQLSKPLRDEESHIRMDYFRLKQVLINLVQNALKFTHEGEVRFGHMKPANEKIEFFVTDTGIGIPPQEQPLIFERFKQLENPASAKYEGSGLGLAITKSIIELLGGEIHVDSAVDQGSKFTFALPYLPVQSGFPSQKQKKERIAYNWTGKTIVIVEDNKMNAYLMKKNIEKTRANIVLLYNGVEVIEYFEKGHVADMVLMDLQLPEMNGHDAARAIRTMNPNIPIIAQTANVFVDRKTLQNDGFVELITKPIDFKSMLLAMNRYLINVVKNS